MVCTRLQGSSKLNLKQHPPNTLNADGEEKVSRDQPRQRKTAIAGRRKSAAVCTHRPCRRRDPPLGRAQQALARRRAGGAWV